jgi:hypothetical protein
MLSEVMGRFEGWTLRFQGVDLGGNVRGYAHNYGKCLYAQAETVEELRARLEDLVRQAHGGEKG